MKDFFKEIFDNRGISKNYVQHKNYKTITIPKDVFDEMTEEEVENYVNQTLKDVNVEINSLQKTPKKDRPLTPEEISTAFAQLRRLVGESFKDFYLRK
jgi:single-stranded DNA-specific DHH superfamily exonuclease